MNCMKVIIEASISEGQRKGEIAEIKDVINTFYCDISVSYAFQSNTIVLIRQLITF